MPKSFWLRLSWLFIFVSLIALAIDIFTRKSRSQTLEGKIFSDNELQSMTEEELRKIVASTIFVNEKSN